MIDPRRPRLIIPWRHFIDISDLDVGVVVAWRPGVTQHDALHEIAQVLQDGKGPCQALVVQVIETARVRSHVALRVV